MKTWSRWRKCMHLKQQIKLHTQTVYNQRKKVKLCVFMYVFIFCSFRWQRPELCILCTVNWWSANTTNTTGSYLRYYSLTTLGEKRKDNGNAVVKGPPKKNRKNRSLETIQTDHDHDVIVMIVWTSELFFFFLFFCKRYFCSLFSHC